MPLKITRDDISSGTVMWNSGSSSGQM